jgi:hypothetical protein
MDAWGMAPVPKTLHEETPHCRYIVINLLITI